MADYIYLLQNRLTPAQRRALEAVRDAARTHGMPVFLVGGAVRDLTSGAPVRDLDFAVQGDSAALLEGLKANGAAVAGENPALSSFYLTFPGGVRVEIGPTLTVSFPKPGKPETQSATILDDLRRRDFTANAMAISLNEGSYGLLLDPLNGVADLENRELRLVSNYGFIEQPALLLRAARLSERLGWSLEERTQGRYETAKSEEYIAAIPELDRGYEIEEIFHEEDPLGALEHLHAEGWGAVLYPPFTAAKADQEAMERVRDLMGQMEQMGIHIDPSPVFFPLLTAKLAPAQVSELKALFPRRGFVEQIDSLDARSKELATQMTAKAATPSETWKLLFSAEPEVVLWLAYSSRTPSVQSKFRAFLNDWPQMRQKLPYALMQDMRITPDLPGYDQLLEDLFFASIDGRLGTPEATRAFLEPYSPPAPAPQASPRRRPAKSARGRSRRVVEEVSVAEMEDKAENLTGIEEDERPALPDSVVSPPADTAPAPAAGDEEHERSAPSKKAAAKKTASAPASQAPAAAPAKTATVKSPAKAPSAPQKPPAKAAERTEASPKPKPAKEISPAPVSTKAIKTPAKAPTPQAAKAAPQKATAVTKSPANKSASPSKTAPKAASKSAKAPSKAVKPAAPARPVAPAKKTVAGKTVPGKTVAKAAARKSPAPAKKAAAPVRPAASPKKAAKAVKTAVKTRGR